ncbi:MAG: hypothetical protein C0593_05200 [Marinilabiliales bacterium]|nr:MAG: hypothetical protein C0593_05200 [Marinilabiliales bacterium]
MRMKNLRTIILVILSLGFFASALAQEAKKEAKVKIVKNVNGETVVVDTIIKGGQHEIDVLLKDLGVDEEISIDMDMDVEINEDGKQMIFMTATHDTVKGRSIIVKADGKKGEKAKVITIDLDSEDILIDEKGAITMSVSAAIDEAMEAVKVNEEEIKIVMESLGKDGIQWINADNDSITLRINAEMETLGKELEDLHIYMSEPGFDDEGIYFYDSKGHNKHFNFYTSGEHFVKIGDLSEEEWKYFDERGYKSCKNTFTPMDISIERKPHNDALKLSFNVTPNDDYNVLLLNEDFTPVLEENFSMSAGSYDRTVDIPGNHKIFYLQIVKGRSCYTKVIKLL